MGDLSRVAHFTAKTIKSNWIAGDSLWEEFECHGLPQFEVICAIDIAHSAATQQTDNTVSRAEFGSGYESTVIRRRFGVYEEETAPVIAHYDPELVGLIDAMGTPAEVLQRILADVVPVLNERFANPLGA